MATWKTFGAAIGLMLASARLASAQGVSEQEVSKQGAPSSTHPAAGGQAPEAAAPRFAVPTRVLAGPRYAGLARRYPSPVLHDVNGDGLADLVLGDLYGSITVSLREAGEGPVRFGAEAPLHFSDGSELVFSNW